MPGVDGDHEHTTADLDEHLEEPPMKRRRTVAESVISTAFSAALIGAAVGVAAYRAWQGRGNPSAAQPPPPPSRPADDKRAPPPPYHPGNWAKLPDVNAASQQQQQQHPHHTTQTTQTARRARKSGRYAHTVGHGSLGQRRKAIQLSNLTVPRTMTPPPALRPPIPHSPVARLQSPQSQASAASSDLTEFDEHADWMGAQLSRLIAEGKRALNRDIVLPNDPDAPDTDGTQGPDEDWMDDEPDRGVAASAYAHHRQHSSSSGSGSGSGSDSVPRALANTPAVFLRSPVADEDASLSPELRERMALARAARPEDASLSPELREHMARARVARRAYAHPL